MNELSLNVQDLIDNPTARVPVCLVLDTSASMELLVSCDNMRIIGTEIIEGQKVNLVEGDNNRTRLDSLNEGLKAFFDSILSDDMASESAEVSIVSFSNEAHIALDFARVNEDMKSINLDISGDGTSLGKALELALYILDERKRTYKDANVDYYQPWIVLLTDGEPTDKSHLEVADKIKALIAEKKLSFFPIGIGDANFNEVNKLSNKNTIRLKETKFSELFEWLGKSVSVVSCSVPGEKVYLNTSKISEWGEV